MSDRQPPESTKVPAGEPTPRRDAPASPKPPAAGPSGNPSTYTALTEAGQKADLVKRFVAAIIDGAIASAIGLIPVIGGLVGLAYILLRDGFELEFMDYRSVGKKLMKLRPVRSDGKAMTYEASFRRNWPLVFGSLVQVLFFIPVIGWLLIPVVAIIGLALGIAEIVLVFTNPEGKRWGDRLAKTKVVEVAS